MVRFILSLPRCHPRVGHERSSLPANSAVGTSHFPCEVRRNQPCVLPLLSVNRSRSDRWVLRPCQASCGSPKEFSEELVRCRSLSQILLCTILFSTLADALLRPRGRTFVWVYLVLCTLYSATTIGCTLSMLYHLLYLYWLIFLTYIYHYYLLRVALQPITK